MWQYRLARNPDILAVVPTIPGQHAVRTYRCLDSVGIVTFKFLQILSKMSRGLIYFGQPLNEPLLNVIKGLPFESFPCKSSIENS
jgi:hypothetical protein